MVTKHILAGLLALGSIGSYTVAYTPEAVFDFAQDGLGHEAIGSTADGMDGLKAAAIALFAAATAKLAYETYQGYHQKVGTSAVTVAAEPVRPVIPEPVIEKPIMKKKKKKNDLLDAIEIDMETLRTGKKKPSLTAHIRVPGSKDMDLNNELAQAKDLFVQAFKNAATAGTKGLEVVKTIAETIKMLVG